MDGRIIIEVSFALPRVGRFIPQSGIHFASKQFAWKIFGGDNANPTSRPNLGERRSIS